MSPDFIEQIINLVKRSSLCAFEFEQAGTCLRISLEERGSGLSACSPAATPARTVNYLSSPAMGVLRLKHPQRDEVFCAVGSEVKEGQVVAFLQNDALLEEIKASSSGVLLAALVEDGDIIGYGQKLFEIR
ncbi:hypothetical protein AWM79_20185 [Pseudomonas agarici]|uniref:Uncharacterized protein n=1 Tax=Pseudomonas agarici TaxID=46677 RepID=A0A0X1T5X1_PSEAA|nr:biotin/lipoyl-containing protein [Pseudomonas agarici]AMB87485.1 hypothetical protein AWM79_20185 [Pseudomonas agarici]NWB90116.1 acetyl-CoA carboxylase biotin carboxyl carrier protein subunit [Pseudomonas agarici]NWC08103.1 acetyl-CoA carboxylase biotin carboxyl carrier protein subunit [Pseudomonas agarici]SEK86717.1 biotin carboxyl carrier protein [Pseudomonas agarici]